MREPRRPSLALVPGVAARPGQGGAGATGRRCPRCGEALPDDARIKEYPAAPGFHPAFKVRHAIGAARGKDATYCTGYRGPETAEGAG